MKFGKELKIKSIPAWREQYMSYKPLKRVITRLAMQMKEQRDREEKAEFDSAANGDSDAQPPPTTERVPLLRRESSTTGAQVQRRLSRVYGTTTELNGGGGGGGGAAADVSEAEQREMITGDAKKEFRAIIDNDIDKVNLHYKGKLADCKAAFQRIYDTVRDSGAEERRERGARGGGEEGSASAIIEVPADGVSKEGNGTAVSQSSTSAPAASSSSPSPPTGIPDLDRPLSHIRSTSPLSMPPLTPLPSTQPRPSISVSLSKQLEVQSAKLLSLYRESCQLASFSELNHAGLRKIMKKLDKQTGEEGHQEEMIQRLQGEPFMETEELKDLLAREEELYHRLMLAKGEDVRESGARLRAIKKEVDEPSEEEDHDHTAVKYRYLMLAFFAYFLVLSIPLLPPSQERAQRCAALLSLITILWVTEAIPFFVSSLLIPFFVIITGILADEQGNTLSAEKASKVAFGAMFNDTIMLILGGFSISTAFSQCGFELRLAAILQRQLGHRPILFLLAFMGLGAFLSMWISNVAAPVLLTSLLLPIVHDFGSGSNDARTYAKALLLGLAFACNIGGMMSPISSPQNAVALGFLEQQDPEHVISFVQWLYISIPYCTLGLLGAWLWLWKVYIGEGVEIPSIPAIVYEKRPLTRTDYSVIGVSLLTILLWCSLSYTRPFLGEMGTVAVIPMVTFFGTGFLSKTDLCKKFKWSASHHPPPPSSLVLPLYAPTLTSSDFYGCVQGPDPAGGRRQRAGQCGELVSVAAADLGVDQASPGGSAAGADGVRRAVPGLPHHHLRVAHSGRAHPHTPHHPHRRQRRTHPARGHGSHADDERHHVPAHLLLPQHQLAVTGGRLRSAVPPQRGLPAAWHGGGAGAVGAAERGGGDVHAAGVRTGCGETGGGRVDGWRRRRWGRGDGGRVRERGDERGQGGDDGLVAVLFGRGVVHVRSGSSSDPGPY